MAPSIQPDPLTVAVGDRLRTLRRGQGMTMADVERASDGRYSGSVVGAYERADRAPSLAALAWFASFYGVPIAYLLGDRAVRQGPPRDVDVGTRRSFRFSVHLPGLESNAAAAPVDRIMRNIVTQRGTPDVEWATVRASDLDLFAAALGLSPAETVGQLLEWGAQISGPSGA